MVYTASCEIHTKSRRCENKMKSSKANNSNKLWKTNMLNESDKCWIKSNGNWNEWVIHTSTFKKSYKSEIINMLIHRELSYKFCDITYQLVRLYIWSRVDVHWTVTVGPSFVCKPSTKWLKLDNKNLFRPANCNCF